MKEFPDGSWGAKAVKLWRYAVRLRIPVYAAHTGYFIMLSLFPMLVLLLGLLRYTGLAADTLTDFLRGVIPEALMAGARRLILSTYQNTSGTVISISALAALWSSSRGIHGLMTGLNRICGARESRGWLYTRLVSVMYTFLFLVVLLLTLILSVFGTTLVRTLPVSPVLALLDKIVGLRFILLLVVQTALFCAMFMALPCKRSRLRDTFPGAVVASLGWLSFSDLFSLYVEHFTGYANVYGSVYAVALTMLWLYICLSIVFYGCALNVYLTGNK